MKTFTASILATSAFLALTSASPLLRRNGEVVPVTLKGATDDPNDKYTINVPVNGAFTINSALPVYQLSISRVEYDHDLFACYFIGVDSDKGPNSGPREHNGQLGPPQAITKVGCQRTTPAKRDYPVSGQYTIPVTLVGAIGGAQEPTDQYTVDVVVGGDATSTAAADPRKLSISRTAYNHDGVKCDFTGVDSPSGKGPVEGEFGQLGPPQIVTSVKCYNQ